MLENIASMSIKYISMLPICHIHIFVTSELRWFQMVCANDVNAVGSKSGINASHSHFDGSIWFASV